MAGIGRPNGTANEQRREIWRRWKEGQSLSDIGRALGKIPGSIHHVVKANGGYVPAERSRSARVLSLVDREEISRGLAAGLSFRVIGAKIGRCTLSTMGARQPHHAGARRHGTPCRGTGGALAPPNLRRSTYETAWAVSVASAAFIARRPHHHRILGESARSPPPRTSRTEPAAPATSTPSSSPRSPSSPTDAVTPTHSPPEPGRPSSSRPTTTTKPAPDRADVGVPLTDGLGTTSKRNLRREFCEPAAFNASKPSPAGTADRHLDRPKSDALSHPDVVNCAVS